MISLTVWPAVACCLANIIIVVSSNHEPILEQKDDKLKNYPKAINSKRDTKLGRIFQGRNTTIEQHPWHVSIQVLNFYDHDGLIYSVPAHICGGSIIDKQWVVTAAHCNPKNHYEHWWPILIVAGVTNKQELTNAHAQVFRVQEWIDHEAYDINLYEGVINNDIALVKIKGEFKFTAQVQKVAVASPTNDLKQCTVSGWGEGSGDTLDEADAKLLDETTCRQETKAALLKELDPDSDYVLEIARKNEMPANEVIQALAEHAASANLETKICTWVEKNSAAGVCLGDSGGPLICKNANNEHVLVGLSSYGEQRDKMVNGSLCSENPAHFSKSSAPEKFTKVGCFKGWLDETSMARRLVATPILLICYLIYIILV